MRRLLCAFYALCFQSSLSAQAHEPWAVLSIRQYQMIGASNLHLYLYTLDGRLVKQLTKTPGLDDTVPLFDTRGNSVLFFRQATDDAHKTQEGYSILDLTSGRMTRLSKAEEEAREKGFEPTLTATPIEYPSDNEFQGDPAEGKDAGSCVSADDRYKLVRLTNPAADSATMGFPFTYLLKIKGGPPLALETLPTDAPPDYQVEFTVNVFLQEAGTPFVITPPFEALFMERHVDSTDGQALWGLDLKAKRWTLMSENSGTLYTLPGRPGVIFIHSVRYEPVGGWYLHCAYLEFWNANFKPVRLGPQGSLFHGAAINEGDGKTLALKDPDFGS